jgi:hypothetical protein
MIKAGFYGEEWPGRPVYRRQGNYYVRDYNHPHDTYVGNLFPDVIPVQDGDGSAKREISRCLAETV